MQNLIGKTILHYQIIEQIGRGGMGVVYKARDLKLKRIVAIKFLPHSAADGPEKRDRFKNEAHAAAALNHPNIATIHAIEEIEPARGDVVDGELFIVMEYVDGMELKEIITDSLSLISIFKIASQIAAGLKAAHEKGVIHRDIKSSNIMISESGHVKIMDFGLAKIGAGSGMTREHSTPGTLAYMSPEQLTHPKDIDGRTDIWSFGVLCYQMLSDALPFQGDINPSVMYAILNREPEKLFPRSQDDPATFAALAGIAEKALEKSQEKRYGSMQEILDELEALENRRLLRKAELRSRC